MQKKKTYLLILIPFIFIVCLSGCAKWQSVINDLHGSLIGNSYSIYTYDNYGSQTLKTSGNKISITGNKIETTSFDSEGKAITGYDLSSVITITVDGKEIESCGDTCVFVQKGLGPEVDFSLEEINSNGGGSPASIARVLNKYKNDFVETSTRLKSRDSRTSRKGKYLKRTRASLQQADPCRYSPRAADGRSSRHDLSLSFA